METVGAQGKTVVRPSLSVLRRIFARLKAQGACWLWTGMASSNGYGRIKADGKSIRVHRVMFAAFYGDIPAGYDVHHSCHQRLCVNPEHLSLLARGANTAESNNERSKHQHRSGDSTRLFDMGSGEKVAPLRCSACCGRGWQEDEKAKLCRVSGGNSKPSHAQDNNNNAVPF